MPPQQHGYGPPELPECLQNVTIHPRGKLGWKNVRQVVDDSMREQLLAHPLLTGKTIACMDGSVARRPAGAPPSSPLLYAFNPSMLGADHLFVKLSTFSYCDVDDPVGRNYSKMRPHGEHLVASYNRGRLHAIVEDAEDPRAFWLGERLSMTFTRRDAKGSRQMWLATWHTSRSSRYHEVPLRCNHQHTVEANWVPLVHDEELLMQYSLCPHRVLRCNVTSGWCAEHAWTEHPSCSQSNGVLRSLHGGAPMVRAGPVLLGLAHRKRSHPASDGRGHYHATEYVHTFFTVRAEWPFDVLEFGSLAMFPRFFQRPWLDQVQFSSSLTFLAGAELLANATLRVAYGVADCVALTADLGPLDAKCWHEIHPTTDNSAADAADANANAANAANAADTVKVHSSTRAAFQTAAPLAPIPNSPLTYAVVIKGPLLPFTRAALEYYLSPRGLDRTSSALVFTHTNGTCATAETAAFLHALAFAHPETFAAVLSPPPPHLGQHFRNVQREVCFHGARYALHRWHVKYILMHRSDGAFQKLRQALPGLAALLRALPPPPAELTDGRLGFCPFQTQVRHTLPISLPTSHGPPSCIAPRCYDAAIPQTSLRGVCVRSHPLCSRQLTDFYGRFHLDDHCIFGRVEAMMRYFSLSNPFYNRSRPASTQLPAEMRRPAIRRTCTLPGPEADNGLLWVLWDEQKYGLAVPQSTKALLAERAFTIDPASFEHVAVRGGQLLDGRRLPLDPAAYIYRRPGRVAARLAPFGPLTLCVRRTLDDAHGIQAAGSRSPLTVYDCSGSPEVQNRTDPPSWPCPLGEAGHTHC